jgi:hypothetical protein
VDLYYLGYRRTGATFDQGHGRELRHSWGARLWKTSTGLDYNVEAVFQAGRFADATIRAWTARQTPVTRARRRDGGRGSPFGPMSRAAIGIDTTIGSARSTRCFRAEGTSD